MRQTKALSLVIAGLFITTGSPAAQAARPTSQPAARTSIDPANPPKGVFLDEWYAVMLSGRKCGSMHTRFERIPRKDGDLIQSWTKMRLALRRDQAEVSVGIEQKSTETLDGRPQSFLRTMYLGRQPVTTEGTVNDGKVTITTTQFGQALPPQTYDYPKGALMEWGLYREQFRRGLKPGTRYETLVYEPTISPDRGCKTTVEILQRETVDLFGRKVDAIKTRQIMELPKALPGTGAKQETTLWVTESGDFVRLELSILDIAFEVLACSKAVAMADNDPAEFMVATLVPIADPIDAERAARVTYRIGLRDPAEDSALPDFPDTGMQKVVSRSSRSVTLAVTRQSVPSKRPAGTLGDEDRRRYLAATSILNYTDPKVAALAKEAGGDETDPRKLADKLSRFVNQYVQKKSLNVGFATASEVARSREGDCTEHGVLLAALGRAHNIPSRIVTGLVYADNFGGKSSVLVGHLWTQFWIDGRWLDIDAALGQHTDVDPTHIAMSVGSAGDDGFADLVASTWLSLGRLSITVTETELLPTSPRPADNHE